MFRFTCGLLTLLGVVVPAFAQSQDLPAFHVPLAAPTPKEISQRQALYLFADGVIYEREDRLLEAMRAYEQAAQLDPDAVAVLKALLMIYIAVERNDDAGALLQKVLELDPQDYQMSYLRGRQLRARGQFDEACTVLLKGLQSTSLCDRPDLHQQMEYDLGVLYERLERRELAAAAFGRAVAILDHPDGLLEGRLSPEEIQMRSAEMHERVGRNFLDAGKYDEAIAAYRRAQAKYPPGAGRLHYHLAQVHLKQGKSVEALAELDQYLAMLPPGTDGYELKIGLLQKLKREAEILPWLERASTQDRFNVGLRLFWAKECARLGQAGTAEKIYREMAESGPTEAVYRDLFLLYKDHHPQGADYIVGLIDATIEKASRKDSPANDASASKAKAMMGALRDNPPLARVVLKAGAAQAQRQPLQQDTLEIFGAIADRLDMLPEAEVLYRECIKKPLPAVTEPLIYGNLLRVLWKAQRPEAIVETCRTGLATAQASNRVLLRGDLARALAQLQRWDEALREADQAVRDAGGGDRFPMRLLRVRVLLQAGRLDVAEADCLALIKEVTLPGEVLEVRYLLSNVYSLSKRLPRAEVELQECLKIDATNPTINNDLGYLWADQNKNLAEAEALIRKAIDQDRKDRQGLLSLRPQGEKEFHDNACYIDSLGWVLFRRGKFAEARKELEYAAGLPDGDDPGIWDHLGDVCLAQHDAARAAAAWRTALHFYDEGKRRKMDERSRMLQEKLKQIETLHTP